MSVSFWHFVAWKAKVHISQTPLHIKFCFRFHQSAAVARDLILRRSQAGREAACKAMLYRSLQVVPTVLGVASWSSGHSQDRTTTSQSSRLRHGSHFPPQCSPAVPSGSHAQRPVYGQPSQQRRQHLVPLLNPFLLKSTICPLHSHPYKKHNVPFSHVPPFI